MPCIYCLKSKDGKQPRAHIFPESIFGDHDELVLSNGEVCGDCNKRIGKLESQFKDRLGLIPMLVGPGVNKRGRPVTVDVPGIKATVDPRNPLISVNTGKQPAMFASGVRVRPGIKKGERVAFVDKGQRADGMYEFSLRQELRFDEPVVRVLAKIAFETICIHRGPDYCADSRWHRVRSFILRGEGKRVWAMPSEIQVSLGEDRGIPAGIRLVPVEVGSGAARLEEWIAIITIRGIPLTVDMSPECLLLPALVSGLPPDQRERVLIKTCEGKGPKRAA